MRNPLPLNTVAVIGTGYLGTQIAILAAYTGYKVKVFDTKEGAFWRAFEIIHSDLKDKGIQPVIPWEQWDTCAKAIQQVLNIEEAMKDAELVIEAVPENLELKKGFSKILVKKHHLALSWLLTVLPFGYPDLNRIADVQNIA